ncbi:hypothetical protein F4860DRAFT_516471 [Xylaria cubensis]|nr:hypothetical protein F4860DRAFT_516471 [Xylaria cubensis]
MSSRREQIYAERRRARYQATQAALSPTQLEEQNNQTRTLSNKLLAQTTASQLNRAKVAFLEYMTEEYPDVDAASEFFSLGAKLPDIELLKAYARYLSRSRFGKITDVITRASNICTYMSQLFGILRRESQPDDSRSGHFRVVRHELFKSINNDLVEQEGLNTAMRPKAVAHSQDLTYLLDRLYDSEYLNTSMTCGSQVTAETREFLMGYGPHSQALKIDPVPMPEAQEDLSLEDMGMMDPGLIDEDILHYSD